MAKEKGFFKTAFAVLFYNITLFEEFLYGFYAVIAIILMAVVLMIFNPLVLWPIAAISKGGMRFAMSLITNTSEFIPVRGLYQGLFNYLPLSRRMMFPKEFHFSAKEQLKIAEKYGAIKVLEFRDIDPEVKRHLLANDTNFRLAYIRQKEVSTSDADVIYNSGDSWAVSELLSKRCPSASQAEQLLMNPDLFPLLTVYAAKHVPSYIFLRKVKEKNPSMYQKMIATLNEKADIQVFSEYLRNRTEYSLERARVIARKKLGCNPQKALLACGDIELVNIYLEHDALSEKLIIKLSNSETNFARELFRAYTAKYKLSEEAKAIIRQGAHASVVE